MNTPRTPFKEKLAGWTAGLRQRLTQIKDSLRQANSREFDFDSIKSWFADQAEAMQERFQAMKSRESTLTWQDVRTWFQLHGRQLALYLLLPLAGLVLIVIVQQQTHQQVSAMYLHQAQLTALESMIYKSKITALDGDPSPTLNDNEVETIRIMLQNRGISPNTLRLDTNRDGGSVLELQAERVAFGQWIAFLDEAALRWDLFPTELIVHADDVPEIVTIRAVLQQTTEVNSL
jgi:hypothetical protein